MIARNHIQVIPTAPVATAAAKVTPKNFPRGSRRPQTPPRRMPEDSAAEVCLYASVCTYVMIVIYI